MNMTSSRALRTVILLLAGSLLAGCATGGLKGNKSEGLKLAHLLRDQGRLEAAADVYARLDVRGLLNGPEMLEYASVAAPVRQPAQALTLYSRARDALGGSLENMSSSEALAICTGMGRAELALGQMGLAQQSFTCALQRDSKNVTALNGAGVLLDAQGQHEQARQRFQQALTQDPGNIPVMNNLALSWLASGQADRAIQQLSNADASNPSVRLNLALAWLVKGDEDKARDVLSQLADASQVDTLLTSLKARAAQLSSSSNTLLMASTQPLSLSEPNP
ncbi:tetratricopeptide repeat protein [Candidatus Pantoea multigeneris]|uniref:Tetratricopeptide repeat protein n=1 Tax=Candidatus Pantoea multigeneris TaxID=2608357 RepID=A0ABX0RCV7_9GAMM|nr:tetratricopeptide repeat protein [Pantoea multigeneris]NIF21504.1 tetratricopeptide repeat protein [Pantoea multigeneris]